MASDIRKRRLSGDESQAKRYRVDAASQAPRFMVTGEVAVSPRCQKITEESLSSNHSVCSNTDYGNTVTREVDSDQLDQLCEHCFQSNQVVRLYQMIELLQQENKLLQGLATKEALPPPPRVQVIHQVICECDTEQMSAIAAQFHEKASMDPPCKLTMDRKWRLRGQDSASDQDIYLDQNPDVILLV